MTSLFPNPQKRTSQYLTVEEFFSQRLAHQVVNFMMFMSVFLRILSDCVSAARMWRKLREERFVCVPVGVYSYL